ncbi:MAG: DUF4239 domain-containing protein [Planctomycetota bacterium]|nr:DUF4239 domain-containing protein [Planctomycetota bacterium]
MFYWIYDIPNWQLAAMISGGFVLIYWFGAIFISPILRRLVRSTSGSNDVVGYILSSFGVFYGLLLGLIAIAAHQNYTNVEDAVAREAIALSALNQDSKAYPEPLGQNLRWVLRDYCRYVIKYAWPLQQKGIIPEGGRVRVTAFHEKLLSFEPQTSREEIIHAETLRQFNNFFECRRMRLQAVTTSIPPVMWYVVIVGAFINLVIVWMFDMRLMTQFTLGGLLSLFLGTMMFLIAAMDNPLRGEVSVSPAAFELVYKVMMDDAY